MTTRTERLEALREFIDGLRPHGNPACPFEEDEMQTYLATVEAAIAALRREPPHAPDEAADSHVTDAQIGAMRRMAPQDQEPTASFLTSLNIAPAAGAMSEVDEQRAAKDEAYLQRNHLVAALARLFPSGIRRTNIEGWSADWHGCCLIDLPSGQISYHYHDSHAHLFADLPAYTKLWDGHEKETVHARLAALRSREAGEPVAWKLVSELDDTRGVAWIDFQATRVGKIDARGRKWLARLYPAREEKDG